MLLETIREYALDRLNAHDERQAVQRRRALYYVCLAEEAQRYLQGASQRRWLERLDREAANIWSALRWTLAEREIVLGLRLAGAMVGYTQYRRSLSEGRNWFEELLACDEPVPPEAQEARSKVLYGAGVMASLRHELTLARQRLIESAIFAAYDELRLRIAGAEAYYWHRREICLAAGDSTRSERNPGRTARPHSRGSFLYGRDD